nr:hypothetical protein [Candidatus Sigynarchaeota archaeon]
MDLNEITDADIEIKQISDRELRPDTCIACGNEDVKIATHSIHDLWDLGSPGIVRVLRHEQIRWECKKCHEQFTVFNMAVPFNSSYTSEVIKYTLERVLKNGDSMSRVAKDLNELHHVKIDVSTISKWMEKERDKTKNDQQGNEKPTKLPASGVVTMDGTFKSVDIKKKDLEIVGDQPFSLHLTRLKNGKLVAILPLGKAKTK